MTEARLELVWPGKDKFLLVPKDTDGKPVFVGLAPGTGADFLTDLRDRSFTCPLLVVLRRQIVNVETFDW